MAQIGVRGTRPPQDAEEVAKAREGLKEEIAAQGPKCGTGKTQRLDKGQRQCPAETGKTASPPSKPVPPVCKIAAPASIVSAEAIRKALTQPIEVRFVETPFGEAMECLQQTLKIPIQLDLKALTDAGVAADTPITRNLRGSSARKTLELILRELDLTWVIDDGVLLVTTPDRAENRLQTTVYDVGDLVRAVDEQGHPANDFDQLVEVITSTIKPTSWDTAGGPGSIAPFETDRSALLVVSQTQRVHEELETLLADLRKADQAKPGERAPRMIHRAVPKARPMVGGLSGAANSPNASPANPCPAAQPPATPANPSSGNIGGAGGGTAGGMF
jgi:hypothetical protein